MFFFGFFIFKSKQILLPLLLILLSNATAEKVDIVISETTAATVSLRPALNKSISKWAANDSYIKAYMDLRKAGYFKRNDQYESGDSYNTVIRSSYMPSVKYPSLTHTDNFVNPTYSTYPPVSPSYGHYHHHYHYEEVSPTHHETPYSSPTSNFFTAIHKKLSLKLILKIILKLVLFKMIVKFIAVLCLLLFIPTLKSQEITGGSNAEHDNMRSLDLISNFIWNSIKDKNSIFGLNNNDDDDDDDETKTIKDIIELDDDDNSNSGPESAVRFLQFCIDTVNRIVGLMLSYLKRQRNEEVDLKEFFFKKLKRLSQHF